MNPDTPRQYEMRRYAVFISYRHADNKENGRQWATWLHQALEGYEIPRDLVGTNSTTGELVRESLYPVFRDEQELPADADLTRNIRQALDNSALLVVLCSPRAVESRFVAEEIRYFKELGRSERILALLIDGEPNASGDPEKIKTGVGANMECLPEPLRYGVERDDGTIDWEAPTQPLAAADVRPEGKPEQGWTTGAAYREALLNQASFTRREADGKVKDYQERLELAKLKVISGAIGVPLGVLTERDKVMQLARARRRARIFYLVAIAMGTLALLAVGGGIFAWKQKTEAEKQRKVADEQRQSAEQRKAEADHQKQLAEAQTVEAKRQKDAALHLLAMRYLQQASANFNYAPTESATEEESEKSETAAAKSRTLSIDRTPSLSEFEHWRQGLAYLAASVRADPTYALPENGIVQVLSNWNWPLLDQTYPLIADGVSEVHWTTKSDFLALKVRKATDKEWLYVDLRSGNPVDKSRAGKVLSAEAQETASAMEEEFLGSTCPGGKQMVVIQMIPTKFHETWMEYKCSLQLYRFTAASDFESIRGKHSCGRFTWEELPSSDGNADIAVRLSGDSSIFFRTHLPQDGTSSRCLALDEKRAYLLIGNSTDPDQPTDRQVRANVQLWDVKQNRVLWNITLEPCSITDLAINSEQHTIALNRIVEDDVPIRYGMVIDEITGKDISPACADGSKPHLIKLIPNSSRMVLRGAAKLELRDLNDSSFMRNLAVETDDFNQVLISPTGTVLAQSDDQNGVNVISLNENSKPLNLPGQLANSNPVWFSPDESHLLVADNDTMSDSEVYQLFDTTSGNPVSERIGNVVFGGASPDDNWLVLDESEKAGGSGSHEIVMVDAETGGQGFEMPLLRYASEHRPIRGVRLSYGAIEREMLMPNDLLGDSALHVSFYPPPGPGWLANLAEAASGLIVDHNGNLEKIEDAPKRFEAVRNELKNAPHSPLVEWGRAYLSQATLAPVISSRQR